MITFNVKRTIVNPPCALAAPAMLIPRNSGLVAILELEGNPADVIDGFDRAEDMDDPLRLLSGKDTAGKSWAGGLITTAGGLRRFRRARHGRRHERRDGTECGD